MGGMILTKVRAVFFDAVGTLLVPEPPAIEIYLAVAACRGLTLSSGEVGRRFRAAYWAEEEADRLAAWVTNEQRELARWRRIVGTTLAGIRDPEACFRELFEHFAHPAAWRVDSDTGPVLAALRNQDLILGIGSNYDARLEAVLKGFPQLADLHDRMVISAAVGYRKPAQAFFQEVIRLAACEPGEILFVGDDFDNDYLGARSAGLQAALLDPTKNDARAAFRISRLRQLLD